MTVFETSFMAPDYKQMSLLPRQVTHQRSYCNNQSFAVSISFLNRLFGVSNLRVVTQPDKGGLCVLGRTREPEIPGQCVGWLDPPGGHGLLLLDEVDSTQRPQNGTNVKATSCFTNSTGQLNVTAPSPPEPSVVDRSFVCHEHSQVIMPGQQVFRDRPNPLSSAPCELLGKGCPADYPTGSYSLLTSNRTADRSCYSWFTSLDNLGTFEITNKTSLENYLDPNLVVNASVWTHRTQTPRNVFDVYRFRPWENVSGPYIGWGDGVLCGQQQHMMSAAAACYNRCYQNWTQAQNPDTHTTYTCNQSPGQLFKGPNGPNAAGYEDGSHCPMFFERYQAKYHQLGAPAQTHSRYLASTLGSSTYGILNHGLDNLGDVASPNTTVTNGVAHESANASAYMLPIKYAASGWNASNTTGHCYTPLTALPGYQTKSAPAFVQRADVALPTAQALAKLQLESNNALLVDQQSTAVNALQNAAQLVAPAINIATVLLTATTCMGTLASIKLLELYTDLWAIVVLTRAGWIKQLGVVTLYTTVVATFAAAPVAAMMWQDRVSRTTDLSYTYGNFIQFEVPGTQLNTLSILSATVTYRADPAYLRAIACVSALLLGATLAWWFYATWRVVHKLRLRCEKEKLEWDQENARRTFRRDMSDLESNQRQILKHSSFAAPSVRGEAVRASLLCKPDQTQVESASGRRMSRQQG